MSYQKSVTISNCYLLGSMVWFGGEMKILELRGYVIDSSRIRIPLSLRRRLRRGEII